MAEQSAVDSVPDEQGTPAGNDATGEGFASPGAVDDALAETSELNTLLVSIEEWVDRTRNDSEHGEDPAIAILPSTVDVGPPPGPVRRA